MKVAGLAIFISCMAVTPSFAETLACKDERGVTKYEVRGNKLLGHEDDVSTQPNVYDLLQNSRNGMIAIRHSPDRLIWMTVGRDGKFIRKLEFVSGKYEETYSGYCIRK